MIDSGKLSKRENLYYNHGIQTRLVTPDDVPTPHFGLVDSQFPDLWAIVAEQILSQFGDTPIALDDVDDEALLCFSLGNAYKEKILDLLSRRHKKNGHAYEPIIKKIEVKGKTSYVAIRKPTYPVKDRLSLENSPMPPITKDDLENGCREMAKVLKCNPDELISLLDEKTKSE